MMRSLNDEPPGTHAGFQPIRPASMAGKNDKVVNSKGRPNVIRDAQHLNDYIALSSGVGVRRPQRLQLSSIDLPSPSPPMLTLTILSPTSSPFLKAFGRAHSK